MLSKEIIIQFMDTQAREAKKLTSCLRKGVGCCLIAVGKDDKIRIEVSKINGPVVGTICTNEVGNCGCMHSEIRVLFEAIQNWEFTSKNYTNVMLCTYSPCTRCANAIVYSNIVDILIYDILTEHDKRGVDILKRGQIKVLTKEEL